MSSDVINYTIAVCLSLAAYGIYRAVCAYEERLARKQATAALGADQHDVGPDALRLMKDLDEHLDAHFARLAPLFEQLGPPSADTGWEAGQQRLRDAVGDEQRGESA
ncbi:hypothetical protein ABZ235_30620 [Streptomyces canus]|uniref:hypothetical protein n=1 Tax=Streptomyces canus TaxID=58343 RepID=UPI0033AEDE88